MPNNLALLAAVEAERRRLAAQLDDSVIAGLNLLLAQANAYEQTLAAGPQVALALGVLNSLLRQVAQQARDLQTSLDPGLLEDLGLLAALEYIAAQQTRATGITVTVQAQPLTRPLPPAIELALFRAAQDGLYAAVHAGATRVSLHLSIDADNQLTLRLVDDGQVQARPDPLATTRWYIDLLGGAAVIDAAGARITFALEPVVDLTPREMEILTCLTEGQTNREIAAQLNLSPRTVNFHLDNIYTKLGVNTRTEAAIYALRQGWNLFK